jgi:hypothetical protein
MRLDIMWLLFLPVALVAATLRADKSVLPETGNPQWQLGQNAVRRSVSASEQFTRIAQRLARHEFIRKSNRHLRNSD